MRTLAAAGLLIVVSLAAGCSGAPDDDAGPSDPAPRRPPPREVLSEEGNNGQCTEVLTGSTAFDFTVDEGYDTIEVLFHATGLGTVGYEITGPDGVAVTNVADYNPASQPCVHDHTAAAAPFAAAPGTYTATVRNTGILGWILVINEVSTAAAATNATA